MINWLKTTTDKLLDYNMVQTSETMKKLLIDAKQIELNACRHNYHGCTIQDIKFNIENINQNDEKIIIQLPPNSKQKNDIFLLELSLMNDGNFNDYYIYNKEEEVNFFFNSLNNHTIETNNKKQQLQIIKYNQHTANFYLLYIKKTIYYICI